MKTRTFICALAAASLGLGSLSFAQGYDRGRDGNRRGAQQRDGDRRGGEHRRRPQPGDYDHRGGPGARGDRGDERRDGRAERYYYGARGPEWRRGGHVPPEYRGRQYVVTNWRAHRLHAPPRGYQWVQVGADYVLVAIATGIILQILINP